MTTSEAFLQYRLLSPDSPGVAIALHGEVLAKGLFPGDSFTTVLKADNLEREGEELPVKGDLVSVERAGGSCVCLAKVVSVVVGMGEAALTCRVVFTA